MRVCLVSTEVAGFRGGGIGTYVVEAGKALTAAGHEVWLVTRDPGRARRDDLCALPAFHRVLLVEQTSKDRERYHYALAHEATWFAARAHDTILGSGVEFDYVEFPDYGGEGYVALLEQKLFGTYGDTVLGLTLHSPTFECYHYNRQLHRLKPSLRELCVLEDEAIKDTPLRLCPSTRLLEMVTERLGLEHPAGHVVRYPMSLPPKAPAPPRPRGSLAELRFLYFGRIEPRKGVDRLIEAFGQLPDLSIRLIGEDRPCSPHGTSYRQWLSRHLPPNVSFGPALSRAELQDEIRAADVCVLPSPWDNWPNACIEAMAASRVVIGGRNGGMSEMIEHGVSGFLVDGEDAGGLVRMISEDLGGALGHLHEIGRAAAVRIRELSDPGRYACAIERIVGEEKAARTPAARVRPRAPRSAGGKTSIIVPYHAEDETILGEAIDSAIGQTHEDLEILIVEDGSPRADAAEVLGAMARRDPRVKVLHKKNGGLASARNFSFAHATGSYYLFLDADNILRPEYVATGLEVFAGQPEVYAIAPQLQIFDAATKERRVIVNPLPFDRALALFRNELGDAGAMFRKEVFCEHGLRYDSMVDVYSDWALWLDCARHGLRVQCVPRVLYDYRLRADSMMAEQAWDRHLALLGLLIERHPLPGMDREQGQLLTTLVQGWGIGAILAALGGRTDYAERPIEVAKLMHAGAVRYRVADALARLAGRVPLLAGPLRTLAAGALRLHGRWKDRRKGAGPG